ncbi:hypothetical protein F0344_00195 [Streptomyces finlayi]|uniref:Uncharacterized protein n=1 Tax=Streptomyces finlayi TaxID=67296 RepID=A0A7G7BD48_9ACTN|nr:hypothetical protein [Streptomyces finlayi]QNE73263.1 hypothetical protein F0344_00195 [Streptomyces finlayi]
MEDIRLRSPEPAPPAAAARSVHPKTDTKATDITLYAYATAADAEELLTRVRNTSMKFPPDPSRRDGLRHNRTPAGARAAGRQEWQ